MRNLPSPLTVAVIGFSGGVLTACDSSGGGLDDGADRRVEVVGAFHRARDRD